jgi:hypothetical protein
MLIQYDSVREIDRICKTRFGSLGRIPRKDSSMFEQPIPRKLYRGGQRVPVFQSGRLVIEQLTKSILFLACRTIGPPKATFGLLQNFKTGKLHLFYDSGPPATSRKENRAAPWRYGRCIGSRTRNDGSPEGGLRGP